MRLAMKIILLVCIIIMVYFVTSLIFVRNIYDDACKEIGFQEHQSLGYNNAIDFCEDIKGNLYFVDVDCKNLFAMPWKAECLAKQIEVNSLVKSNATTK